jgi:hypothetical protein
VARSAPLRGKEERLLAGKHLSPILIYIAAAVIVISLVVFVKTRRDSPPPDRAPLHEPR